MAVTYTPGGASDNCYVTEALADAYFADRTGRSAQWLTWDATERANALVEATFRLERLGGRKENLTAQRVGFWGVPSSETQALHFPRSTDVDEDAAILVPPSLMEAVYEQAYWMLDTDEISSEAGGSSGSGDLVDRAALQAQGVKSFSIDGLSETFEGVTTPRGIAPMVWDEMMPFLRRTQKLVV